MSDDEAWEAIYAQSSPEDLPWFSPHIDPDEAAVVETQRIGTAEGPLLDLGTGPGTFTVDMVKRGFHLVALDVSESAIRMARRRAGAHAGHVEWVTASLFDCDWPARFQLVHDRGVYHSLPEPQRARYAALVPDWLRPGGILMVKTFHEDEPGDWGPNRIAERELRTRFKGRLELLELRESSFPGTMQPVPGHTPRAWLAVYRAPRPTP